MVYTTEYLSPLGTITLACDEEAIIGLWFNGQKHFGSILPRQTERQERPLFQDARRWLDVYFSGRAPDHLPPLRYDSTPFRRQVCEIMLTIPYGSTMTYGQIAAEVARRQGLANMSAQAVGGAVGHNPISLMIPCHRVVGTKKYGDTNGKHQELESPPLVEAFFADLPVSRADVDRISWLAAHHHTDTNVDGPDHRILLEADFLVNADEGACARPAIETMRERVFRTPSAIRLLDTIYLA